MLFILIFLNCYCSGQYCIGCIHTISFLLWETNFNQGTVVVLWVENLTLGLMLLVLWNIHCGA